MAANWWETRRRMPTAFPLLLKFLFPHEKLSVQVHPDDAAARRAGLPCGKTECWYVAHARPGAQIALGLKPGVTREQFERSIIEKRAEELLNWINVYQGEMIYVTGGTVHTLGPGSIMLETQQQSDTTYRLYDYGRPRELHLKEGLAVIKEKTVAGKSGSSRAFEVEWRGKSPCAADFIAHTSWWTCLNSRTRIPSKPRTKVESVRSRYWLRWKAAESSKLPEQTRLHWPEATPWSCLRQ